MPEPFKLRCTLHIPQSKIFNLTARHSVEISPIGHLLSTKTASRFSRVTLRALQLTSVESKSLTYADAGVSIDAGNSLVQRIKPFVRRTQRTGSNAEIGGFGGVFDLKATGYQDPVLVSGTDGVGTKLHVAVEAGIHGTVGEASGKRVNVEKFTKTLQGIDLVAMSVNDLIVQGAEPLYFLDYFACGHLDVDRATSVINGIAEGCIQSGCALIGGETAEMPGMYKKGLAVQSTVSIQRTPRLMLRIHSRRLRPGRVRSRRSRTVSDPSTPRHLSWRCYSGPALFGCPLKRILVGPEDRLEVRFEVFFAFSVGSIHHVGGGSVETYQDLCQNASSGYQKGFVEGPFSHYRWGFP